MRKCTACGRARFWALADGRYKCRSCGHRQRDELSAWDSLWLSDAQKRQLIERFVLDVPVCRQCFRPVCTANTAEKMYRLLRVCCAYAEQWHEPFTGALECDEKTFGGARHGPRGWGALFRADDIESMRLLSMASSGRGDPGSGMCGMVRRYPYFLAVVVAPSLPRSGDWGRR